MGLLTLAISVREGRASRRRSRSPDARDCCRGPGAWRRPPHWNGF